MKILLSLLCLLTLPAWAQDSPSAGERTVVVLHTNDLHGHLTPWRGWEGELEGKALGGMDRLATAVKQVRSEVGADKVLLLDAGDTFGDTMLAVETQGGAMLNAMNAIGYDAMVIGNHDPDFGVKQVKKLAAEARFPLLSANIVDASGRPVMPPMLLRAIDGVSIGILGLSYPNTPLTTAKKNIKGWTFKDAAATAREWVPQLRAQGAEIVVVLSHLGLSADRKLAGAVPDIDVIVGGHSHNRTDSAVREGDTLIVQAGAHGSDLGRLDLKIADGKVVNQTHRLILLDNARLAPDTQLAEQMRRLRDRHAHKLNERIGEAKGPLTRAQTLAGQEPRARDHESPVDSLFADLLREGTRSDVVLLPNSGYGVAIPTGPITADQLRNLVPHESKVVTMTLRGGQLRDILEQSIERTYTDDPTLKVGGLLQVSGLRFSYDPKLPKGQRVKEVAINDAALDDGKAYRVTTNSLFAQGGHGLSTFTEGQDIREGEPAYKLLKQLIERKGSVNVPAPGRIQKVGGQ